MFARPGAPQREEMLTLQAKNTTLHQNGQNLRVAAKNCRISKTPGLHLSATHGKEAVGQFTASPPIQEGTAQLDSLLKSPRPDSDREAENQPVRRPLKLAPLELPQEVREAQKEKLKFIQHEDQPASCKESVMLNEPRTRKVKSCVRQRPLKASVGPSVPAQPLKAQQQNRPQLTRSSPVDQNGDRHLEDVVCSGTPALLRSKPAPPLLSPRVKPRATRGGQATHQSPGTPQLETDRRRLRLRRAHCLEEDQSNSHTSTGGLSADEGKLAQGVRSRGQQAERALRRQPRAGKGVKEPPADTWEHGSITTNHQEVCSQQSVRCPVIRHSGEGGSYERALDGVKPSASNWGLKRKKPLIAKHNNALPAEASNCN